MKIKKLRPISGECPYCHRQGEHSLYDNKQATCRYCCKTISVKDGKLQPLVREPSEEPKSSGIKSSWGATVKGPWIIDNYKPKD